MLLRFETSVLNKGASIVREPLQKRARNVQDIRGAEWPNTSAAMYSAYERRLYASL